MADNSMRQVSNTQLLQDIEALSATLYQSHVSRRAASFALRSSNETATPRSDRRSWSNRMSLTLWRSRPPETRDGDVGDNRRRYPPPATVLAGEKKGLMWRWKPVRALSHIGMQRLGCLFSLEVIGVRGLPASMNGLRLSVTVRKKENKDGVVQTMPSRVLQGFIDFEETLFIRCHVYFTGGGRRPIKLEPRPFVVSLIAVDAPELDFGKHIVDLSLLIRESLEKSLEGSPPVGRWDAAFELSGKAKGGELALKLGFQIVDGIGAGYNNQPLNARRQSRSSFSVPSLRVSESKYSLDESKLEHKIEDAILPGFEVVDKGVEIEERLVSNKVVKQVVHDRETKQLGAEEETVTKEFLEMLEREDDKLTAPTKPGSEHDTNNESRVFFSDLGKGLGAVVQTKDGGYLICMNPFDVEVSKRETPKLAMQISRPFILRDKKQASGLTMFQRLAAMGSDELDSSLLKLAAMDELTGKTTGQIAIEGIASAIISGRNKEKARSSAARSVTVAKAMAAALNDGGKRESMRVEPVLMEEILTISLPKMETMALEALKIQAEMSDEEAMVSTVSPLIGEEDSDGPLNTVVLLEDWVETCAKGATVTLLVIVQLRDPLRRTEAVGAPVIALIQSERVGDHGEDEEGRFKVTGLHMGGLKLRSGERSALDGEEQRLTAMQWLVAHGLVKARKKNRALNAKVGQDSLWSITSPVVADMWLSTVRNPDVKVP